MPAPETLPPDWQPGLDALRALPDGAAALLVGATDRGKTTFTALAAQLLAKQEERVAIVDADIGQSEIGPPGTVGVAWADAGVSRLHDLKPAARFFVGAFTPTAVALEHAVAAGQAVRFARAAGARRILVDTTGFVAGPAARRFKVAKALLVAPALVLALARGDELDPLLSAIHAATGAQTLALAVPDTVSRKSGTVRATRRLTRLSEALDGTREIRLPLAQIVTLGATIGTGAPLPSHLARWCAKALRLPVVYAERSDNTLVIYLDGPVPRMGWESGAAPVAEHFGARTLRALSLRAHRGVYLGLHDDRGRLAAVGRFARLDAEQGELVIDAPPPATADRIRLVAFGRVRVQPDGSAGSEVRPGEI